MVGFLGLRVFFGGEEGGFHASLFQKFDNYFWAWNLVMDFCASWPVLDFCLTTGVCSLSLIKSLLSLKSFMLCPPLNRRR